MREMRERREKMLLVIHISLMYNTSQKQVRDICSKMNWEPRNVGRIMNTYIQSKQMNAYENEESEDDFLQRLEEEMEEDIFIYTEDDEGTDEE